MGVDKRKYLASTEVSTPKRPSLKVMTFQGAWAEGKVACSMFLNGVWGYVRV